MKKVLVLGGSGFLGQNIVRYLKEAYQITSCDRFKPKFEKADRNIIMDIYQTDLCETFDVYIHLIDNKVALNDFTDYERRLAEHLIWNKSTHLILMSSSVLYANPESEYGKRKKLLEEFWTTFCDKHEVKLTILRLFNVFGPYHIPFAQGGLVANIMFNHVFSKQTKINDLSARRTFVFSRDVARVFRYVIKTGITGCYDIAGSHYKSIAELIKVLQEKVFKSEASIVDCQRKEHIFCPKGNPELLVKIGETPFIEALNETYAFYLENKDQIGELFEKESE